MSSESEINKCILLLFVLIFSVLPFRFMSSGAFDSDQGAKDFGFYLLIM